MWTETDLPALQPNVLQLIVDCPVPPETREEASETGSTRSESLELFFLGFFSSKHRGVRRRTASLPVHRVVRVSEPEVHHAIQFGADPPLILLQRRRRHGSYRTERQEASVKTAATCCCGRNRQTPSNSTIVL